LKTLNLGIVGLGGQGKIHFKNCLHLAGVKLLGVAELSAKMIKFAKRNGVTNIYTNYEDLYKEKNLDAVIISLPNSLHLEASLKAAEAGKHVLLEKPLARNVEEGAKIVEGFRKRGLKLMLGYDMRFNPVFVNIKREILAGAFGQVQFAEATNVGSGPFASRSETGGPVPVPSWWFDKELVGGGALLDLGSHLINLLSWYFGEITDVRTYLGHIYNMELEDKAICLMKFKNGPMTSINVGWFSKDSAQSIQILGTAKNVLAKFLPSSTLTTIRKDIERKLGWHGNDPYYTELKYFVKCLQKDEPVVPSGEEGLRDLRTLSLAYENATELI
jgi:predicted dehydrogenase